MRNALRIACNSPICGIPNLSLRTPAEDQEISDHPQTFVIAGLSLRRDEHPVPMLGALSLTWR